MQNKRTKFDAGRQELNAAWNSLERGVDKALSRLAAVQRTHIVHETDGEGRFSYVNDVFTAVYGYRAEELVGQTPRILKSEKHPPSLYEEMWRTLSAGKAWSGLLINRGKDGSLKKTYTGILPKSDGYVAVGVDLTPFAADPLLWERSLYGPNPFAQISDESLRQDHKKLVEALQTVRDLADEHKKNWEHAQQTIALMEAAARDARHKIRALDAAALVSVTDPDGFIVEINDYFSSLTRFDESSIVGKRHNVMRSPQTPDELFDELWQTIVSGRDWRGILQNLDADGRPIWLQTTIHPVVDEEGKIEKYISIQFDATETIELLIAARDEVEKQRAEIYDYRKKIARLTREIRALKHKLERFAGPQNAATAQEEPTPANAPQENSSAVAKTYLLDAEMKDRFEYCLAVGNYDALEEWAENVRNPELAQEVFDILDRLEYHRLNELFRRLQAV